jgi:hypothetical protein
MQITTREADVKIDGRPMRIVVAAPRDKGRHPGILLYSEIFQLTAPIRRSMERLAGYGFVVAAPEIYHRIEPPGLVIPYEDAGDAGRTTPRDLGRRARRLPKAALDWLTAGPRRGGGRGSGFASAPFGVPRRARPARLRRGLLRIRPDCTTETRGDADAGRWLARTRSPAASSSCSGRRIRTFRRRAVDRRRGAPGRGGGDRHRVALYLENTRSCGRGPAVRPPRPPTPFGGGDRPVPQRARVKTTILVWLPQPHSPPFPTTARPSARRSA